MKEHDLFLVDDRIVLEMPRVLGKSWLQAMKSPIPISLKRADLKAELERAISSTYIRISKGTSLSIKLGSLSNHTLEQLYENLVAVIPHLAVRMPMGGWDNVQSLHIKTTTSTSLPIWNCALAMGDADAKEGRFFAPEVNQEQIKLSRNAKEEKDKLIREKKKKKLEQNSERDASSEARIEARVDEVEMPDMTAQPEEIDESPQGASSLPSAKKAKTVKASKPSTSPTSAERKKVSSTNKKLKGLDVVKGLPRKKSKHL